MKLKHIALSASVLLLAACGGSDEDDDDGGGSGADECGVVVDIGLNSSTAGRLESGDCRIVDLNIDSSDVSLADEYRIVVPTTRPVTIVMRSSDVDAFLAVFNSTQSCTLGGCGIAQFVNFDDDSGGGLDALISMDLAAGTYIVVANTATVNSTQAGYYTLTVSSP